MSGEFEADVFGGSGMPTREQTIATRDYLKRHNRTHSVRKVHSELVARGFSIGVATVSRQLNKVEGGNPPPSQEKSAIKEAEKRVSRKRDPRPRHDGKPGKAKEAAGALTLADVMLEDDDLIPAIADLLKDEMSSTHLAIEENRVRMALNIVIMKRMAATPGLLLLDMRGTAALVDAFTVGAKLSGGASIDIMVPTGARREGSAGPMGPNGNGHDMVDVTPKPQTALAADLDAFRRRKAAEDAKRA